MNQQMVFDTFQVLERVLNASGTINKQAILSENMGNPVLKNLLYVAYNPYVQFYVKKIPETTHIDHADRATDYMLHYTQFLQLLVDLSKRHITGNAALEAVTQFFNTCNEYEYKWYTKVLQKDLKIGIAIAGINKVFPKLIPTYEVMLADKVDPNKLLDDPKTFKMLPERMTLQYKIDGYRLNIHRPSEDEIIIRTRNGKVVSGYTDLEKSALQLPVGYVYDGEVVAPEMLKWINQNIINGGVNEANRDFFGVTMSHAFSKETDKKGVFIVFDVVPIDDWVRRSCPLTYEERFHLFTRLVQPLELNNIIPITSSKMFHKDNSDDLNEMLDLFHLFTSQGWEGTMIKDLDAPYQWKRTRSLLKMKLMDTADLLVTEVYEGTGKYTGMMGGVYCDYKGYKLGVGSGFNDDQRLHYWQCPNDIVGKTIEVAYQAETTNKSGTKSLSFPIFKQVRLDK